MRCRSSPAQPGWVRRLWAARPRPYVDEYLPAATTAVREGTGENSVVIGHCLGGVIATLWTASTHAPHAALFCLGVRTNWLATGPGTTCPSPARRSAIKVPFLNVYGTYDHVTSPASVTPLVDLVGSDDAEKRSLKAGHVGLLVGSSARRRCRR